MKEKPEKKGVKNEVDNKDPKNKKTIKRKRLYLRLFFYSFAITFIVGGIIVLLVYINPFSGDFFGISKREYEDARTKFNAQQYDEAADLLTRCIKRNPKNTDAILLLVDIHEKQQKYSDAEGILEKGIEANDKEEALYKRMVQLYTSQNKIKEAFNFIERISSYTKTRLSNYFPENLKTTPGTGSYDSRIDVSFQEIKGCSIYYTIDGTQPTKESSLFNNENPIKIDRGVVTVRAFAINEIGLISDELAAKFVVFNDNTQYEFQDDKLEAIIRANLGKRTGTITYKDLTTLTSLNDQDSDISNSGKIKSISDLEALINLTELEFHNETSIKNQELFGNLKDLTKLVLSNCSVKNETAKMIFGINSLRELDLSNNGISDISRIVSMSNLLSLNISKNSISDVSPLSELKGLTSLKLSENTVADISPLASITTLQELDISGNSSIESLVGISRLTKLTTLSASNVPITTIAELITHTSLINLLIDGTLVSDLSPLKGNTAISTLNISNTKITDFTPLAFTNVKNLTANSCKITEVDSLSDITTLEVVELSNNTITDISPFSKLRRMKTLNVDKNYIVNFDTLSSCTSLRLIKCSGTTVPSSTIKLLETKGVSIVN